MYKKYLIVASRKDSAGMNIARSFAEFKMPQAQIHFIDIEIVDDKGLDSEKIKDYDFIIFASKHQSEKGEKSLSVHTPGNFRKADYGGRASSGAEIGEQSERRERVSLGGKEGKVCPASALFSKQLFENLNKIAKEDELTEEYKITLEATHHGPLIDKPCVFIEIGSSVMEWNSKTAGMTIAKTIKKTIQEFEENPYREIAVGIGGPHYCPNFNKIQEKSNVAISHIIAQYHIPIKEEMILEAIQKTEEEIDFVVLDWKGLGKAEQRDELIKILDKNHINYKKTKDISK